MSSESLFPSGHEPIKRYLSRIVVLDTYPQALLFAGHPLSKKELFAQGFAKLILGEQKLTGKNHPDYLVYKPEGKMGLHSLESIRRLRDEVYLPPYVAKKKVFLIHDAERMLPTGSNALLKTFEEPLSTSVLILLSSMPEKLLPTILSRCLPLYFRHVEEEHFSLSQKLPSSLLEILIEPFSYANCVTNLEIVVTEIEDKTAEYRKEMESKFEVKDKKDLTAVQHEAIEDEIEGACAMYEFELTESLLEALLFWYRDLHLLQAKANEQHLFFPDGIDMLKKGLAKGLPKLESVQEAIAKAKISLQRSTPLQHVLEELLLKIRPLAYSSD